MLLTIGDGTEIITHSFNNYLLAYFVPVPGVILDAGDTTVSKIIMSKTFLLDVLQRDLHVLIYNQKKCACGCLELCLEMCLGLSWIVVLSCVFMLLKTPVSLWMTGLIIYGVPKAGFGVGIWGTFSILFFARFYPKSLSKYI